MKYIWDISNKETYNNRTGHYKFKRQYSFILNNGKNNFDNILDIAGGSGRFAIPLRDYSENILVVDIDKTALQILKKRNSNITTICGDFIKTNFQETFSLMLCIESLNLFPNMEEYFNKINQLLSNNGRLIISYVNPTSWRYFLRKVRHGKKGPSPTYEIKFQKLKDTLKKCNLAIEYVEGMNWIPFPLTSNSKFVTFFEYVEKILMLKKWHSQSPWLLISIKKYRKV